MSDDSYRKRKIDEDVRYSNSKAVFDQIFRRAALQGPHASAVFKSTLDFLLAQSSRGDPPGSALNIDRPLNVEIRPRIDIVRSEGNNVTISGDIGNPAVGATGNRGSKKRKKSILERTGRKSFRAARGRLSSGLE